MPKPTKNNLNIALLVPIFPNRVQPYIQNQVTSLKNHDIGVFIFAGAEDINIPSEHKAIYINTTFKNILKHIFSRTTFSKKYVHTVLKLLHKHHWRKDSLKNIFRKLVFARIISFHDFDVAHSHSLFSTSNYLFLQQDLSIPIITTYHGVLPPGVAKLSRHRILQIFDIGSLFLVNTQSAKSDLVNLGCPDEKISIIPQGINIDKFPYLKHEIYSKKNIKLLSVGRLSSEKGHSIAIKALAELVKTYPAIEYHIVGDGPERENMQELIQVLHLSDNITLHGFKSHDELIPFYTSADIFILPSLHETQGTVLQEAQSSGMPVIASRTGGIPEVIYDNITGLLFTTNDHYDLTNKIISLINSPKSYKELSMNGRNDILNRFDIRVVVQQLTDIYNKVIQSQ